MEQNLTFRVCPLKASDDIWKTVVVYGSILFNQNFTFSIQQTNISHLVWAIQNTVTVIYQMHSFPYLLLETDVGLDQHCFPKGTC